MCELLVYLPKAAQGAHHMAYDEGHVIHVAEDNAGWGRRESYANHLAAGGTPENWQGVFVIIKVPGVDASELRHLTEEKWGDPTKKEMDDRIEEYRQKYKEKTGKFPSTLEIAEQTVSGKVDRARRKLKLDIKKLEFNDFVAVSTKEAVFALVLGI